MLKHSLLSAMGRRKIVLGGLIMGLAIWMAEGMLHFLVFDGESAADILFPASLRELWMRSLVTGLVVAFGVYAQSIINKLHQSRERYCALFENAPDAIFLADVESGEILDANPAAARLLLRPHEEIVGHHQSQLHPPGLEGDSKKIFIEHVEQIRQGEKVQPVEHLALRSDGTEVPVEIAAQLIHIDGRSTVQGIFRDLTEQKKAQEELENANERLRTVLDSLDAFVYVSDMDTHKVLFANKYGRDVWGDITGEVCWKTLQSGQSEPCEFCTNDKLINSDGKPTGVYKWEFQNTVDGQWYSCHDQAIPWIDGRLVRMEIASNITEHKQAQDALRENEAYLAKAQALAHVGHWKLDPKTGTVEGSDELYEIFGLTPEEATLDAFAEVVHPEDREYDLGKIRRGIDHGEPWDIEHRLVLKDGSQKVVHAKGEAITDQTGRTVSLIGTVQDITKRKQAEEQLRESEEKHRRIIEDQTEFLVRWLPDGTRTFVNDSYLRYFGISRDQAIGTSFFPLITEDYREAVRKRIESATPENPTSTDEHEVIRPDGAIGWNQWTDRAIFNEEGRLIEFQSVGRDVTDRKQTQEALQQSEQKYRSLFENMLDGFAYHRIIVDEYNQPVDYEFLEINEAFERLTGLKRHDVNGRRVTEVLPGIQEAGFDWIGEYGKVALEGRQSRFEQYSVELDRWYSISAYSPRRGYFAVTFEDITAKKGAEIALEKSNEQVRLLLDSTAEAIYGLDLEGNCTFCNPACLEMLGYEQVGQLLGKNMHKLIHHTRPDGSEYPMEQCRIYEAFLHGQGTHVDDEVLWRADGTSFPAEYWSYPIRRDGGTVGSVVTFLDITERKRAENALRRHNEFLGNVLESLTHPFLVIDTNDYTVEMANSAAWKAELTKGVMCYELSHMRDCPCDDTEHPCPLEQVRKTGQPVKVEHVHYDQEGEAREVEVHGYPLFDDQGKVTKMIAYCLDVTERKLAEQALEENERQFRATFEQAAVGVAHIAPDGQFIRINQKFCDILGYTRSEMLNRTFQDITYPNDLDADLGYVRQVLAGEISTYSMEKRYVRKDGSIVWGNRTVSLLREDSGEPKFFISVVEDIAERKRVVDEVETYREKMFRAEQLASLGTIGSGLAHQFNQPLSVIRMSMQKALRNLDKIDCPDIVKEVLNDGLSEVSRAGSVAKDFLALGHRFSVSKITKIDIYDLAQQTLSAFDQVARRAGIRLTAQDKLKTLPAVDGMVSELEQMFFILVQNAIQAAGADEGQWLEIDGHVEKERIELTFSDNCGGIEPDYLDKIFEPFFSTKSIDQGTGLGLAILQQIVANHSGSVRAESQLGQGTSFHVTLPIKRQ